MVVGIKDVLKLTGISIVSCCAVFVCTLFLNYNMDLPSVREYISSSEGIAVYNAQVSTGKVTVAVTGGCLVITSLIMLLFYIKNYIDSHGKELGILKAPGYSDIKIAKHFWVFGLGIFVGTLVGYSAAFAYMPRFYAVQNAEKLFPDVTVRFHAVLPLCLILAPTAFFALAAILFARHKLHNPIMNLIKDKTGGYETKHKNGKKERPFLRELQLKTVFGKKAPLFFIAFSAFCFSAMMQMAFSMYDIASGTFAFMILTIGLILAFVTLFMSLTAVVKTNVKTLAMLRAFGYSRGECSRAVLGGYRPVSYLGFIIGTLYQYGLLKIICTIVFSDIKNIASYDFNFIALAITLPLFVLTYELIIFWYSVKINKLPLKSIMID